MSASDSSRRNRLAAEKSPYLLQHAANPVDWYPWGDEAFAKARAENKPIFLSVGYSTCHWCHVMERESFESEAVAALMNDKYVCVKVDREERPDVDRVYMAYVQATTGSGGWPMSVFLTPQLEPFFGGTYFPPGNSHGRPGFTSLLNKIAELWTTQHDDIARSATGAIEAMRKAEANAAPAVLDDKVFDTGLRVFAQSFDAEHAGFGRAPKFPRPVVHDFLLRAYARGKDERAAKMVLATLHLMSRGGMYDHLGGGFHRYSVDQFWHVPHFEKMLYDQAQLVTSCVEMLQLSGDPFLARVTRETCDYVLRDLTHADGGFFSAEDADSIDPANPTGHKIEGAFYVWTRAELNAILGDDAPLFAAFYGVEDEGNADDPHGELTGKNVLHAMQTPAQLAEHLAVPEVEAETRLAKARAKLFAARALRPRPHLDDKILTAWNGMMIGALARASRALHEPRYLAAAVRAAKFVTERLIVDGKLLRRWRDGDAAFPAYLDDHAQLIAGLVELYQACFDPAHLLLAEELADDMLAGFHDVEGGGFFATAGRDPSLLVRMKDDYDGAEPAGNSTAALALFKLADLLDRADFRAAAEGTLRAFSARMMAAPHALPAMVVAYDWSRQSATQVVIAGEDGAALLDAANQRFVPHLLLMRADATWSARLPWLAAMAPVDGKPAAYVCRDHACERPVTTVDELLALLPDHRLSNDPKP